VLNAPVNSGAALRCLRIEVPLPFAAYPVPEPLQERLR
jgi:hypothetical protein